MCVSLIQTSCCLLQKVMSAVDPHKYKSTYCLEAGQLYRLVHSRFKDSWPGQGISVQGTLENVNCGWVKEDDASQPIGSLLQRGRSVFCQVEGKSDAQRKVDAESGGAASECSNPLKNTQETRASVKRKAAESKIVDLASLRNTDETRKEVRRKIVEAEVLDLTGD